MTAVICETIPPTNLVIDDGKRLYRCQNMVAATNDSDEDVLYNVEAIMSDNLGHAATTSARNVVAPGRSTSESGPYFVDFEERLFNTGDQVEFTCQVVVTGGFSAVDRKTNQITIA
jgi:hypothetical protein